MLQCQLKLNQGKHMRNALNGVPSRGEGFCSLTDSSPLCNVTQALMILYSLADTQTCLCMYTHTQNTAFRQNTCLAEDRLWSSWPSLRGYDSLDKHMMRPELTVTHFTSHPGKHLPTLDNLFNPIYQSKLSCKCLTKLWQDTCEQVVACEQ